MSLTWDQYTVASTGNHTFALEAQKGTLGTLSIATGDGSLLLLYTTA